MFKMLGLSIILMITLTCVKLNAQIELKTEYLGASGFKNADNVKTGGKGDARVFSLSARIPLSLQVDENNKPVKAWGIALGGSYTSFSNHNIGPDFGPSKIADANISLFNLRPISEKWSILAMLGVGVYTGHTDLSRVGISNMLGNGGVIFIWHIKKNLDAGLGPVINTLLGYPMIFPGVYVNWSTQGDYEVKVSMLDGLQASIGKRLSDHLKLNLVAEFDGSMALENSGGKKLMFTHQYFSTGLQPQLKLAGALSISATAGISAGRAAYYQQRTLKSIFRGDDDVHNPHFGAAPYFSLSLKYGF